MKKEIPMLFSTPMVIAIDNNTKTETRRTKGLDFQYEHGECFADNWEFLRFQHDADGSLLAIFQYDDGPISVKCPYGKPGDLIWVRENFVKPPTITPKLLKLGGDTWPKYDHVASCSENELENLKEWGWKIKPSIHMPKAAARIWLEILDIKVERLQDISEGDAKAEGVYISESLIKGEFLYEDYEANLFSLANAKSSFKTLWKLINGVKSWNDNPWVWVIEFNKANKY